MNRGQIRSGPHPAGTDRRPADGLETRLQADARPLAAGRERTAEVDAE
ncbi:hypothetical protein HTG_02435 [Natrinema mahii]|nr:hypothetical protein HTG_02435 [Natrinema mahii]